MDLTLDPLRSVSVINDLNAQDKSQFIGSVGSYHVNAGRADLCMWILCNIDIAAMHTFLYYIYIYICK